MKKILSSLLALTLAATAAVTPLGENISNHFSNTSITASAEMSSDGKYEYTVLDDGNIKLTEYKGNGGNITIPKTINGRKVTMIGGYCFNWQNEGCNNLISIIIPEGIRTIDKNAFTSCDNLEWIQFPKSITSVSSWIGYDCDKVTIKVYPGSKAYNYITEIDNNMPYKLIGVTDLSKGKVSKLNSTYTYSGKAIKPNMVVKYGSYILRKNVDYTISYKNNSKVGKATITIKGKKLFKGTITKSFTIKPATVNFKLTAGKKKATVKWSKVKDVSGYKVYYKTSKNGKWKLLKTCSNKTTSYTKTKLASKRTYYFTVKAYKNYNGKTYNASYKTKSVKIK